MTVFTTRFAPSPTGRLHLGHAYSALVGFEAARQAGGHWLLRIEDIDPGRCRQAFIDGIFEDLAWLGLSWPEPVWRQSTRMAVYARALADLDKRGLLYPCFCTRGDIAAEIARSPMAPHGPEGALYPGLCKSLSPFEQSERMERGEAYALRLDCEAAIRQLENDGRWPLLWGEGETELMANPQILGDVVLARKDIPTSYHLAVTVDDAAQDITHVIRGEDLAHATHIQVAIQALLGLGQPYYRHHPLILTAAGRRLAKRDAAQTLLALRQDGVTPEQIRKKLGLAGG